MSSFYTQSELDAMEFRSLGKNVRLSRKASVYNAVNIVIGDNSRIDDFSVLSAGEGGIVIGHNVHIAVFCSLIGAGPIQVDDFSNLSSRVSIYSSNDDYSGETMTNPTVEEEYKNVTRGPVRVGRHVIIGSGAVVLPNVSLEDGACVGALSLVNHDCKAFTVYVGVPARPVKSRSRQLLELEKMREEALASK